VLPCQAVPITSEPYTEDKGAYNEDKGGRYSQIGDPVEGQNKQ
jgi:hypothetical protein